MINFTKHFWFKTIAFILVVTSLTLDIAWAHPNDGVPNTQTLAAPTIFQQRFTASIFADSGLLMSVLGVGNYLLRDRLELDTMPAVLGAELQRIFKDNAPAVELNKVIIVKSEDAASVLVAKTYEELNAAIQKIREQSKREPVVRADEDSIVLVPYEKDGIKHLIQIASAKNKLAKDLIGYEWTISDEFAIRDWYEGYEPAKIKAVAENAPAEAEAVNPTKSEEEALSTEPVTEVETPDGGRISVRAIIGRIASALLLLFAFVAPAMAAGTKPGGAVRPATGMADKLKGFIVAHWIPIVAVIVAAGAIYLGYRLWDSKRSKSGGDIRKTIAAKKKQAGKKSKAPQREQPPEGSKQFDKLTSAKYISKFGYLSYKKGDHNRPFVDYRETEGKNGAYIWVDLENTLVALVDYDFYIKHYNAHDNGVKTENAKVNVGLLEKDRNDTRSIIEYYKSIEGGPLTEFLAAPFVDYRPKDTEHPFIKVDPNALDGAGKVWYLTKEQYLKCGLPQYINGKKRPQGGNGMKAAAKGILLLIASGAALLAMQGRLFAQALTGGNAGIAAKAREASSGFINNPYLAIFYLIGGVISLVGTLYCLKVIRSSKQKGDIIDAFIAIVVGAITMAYTFIGLSYFIGPAIAFIAAATIGVGLAVKFWRSFFPLSRSIDRIGVLPIKTGSMWPDEVSILPAKETGLTMPTDATENAKPTSDLANRRPGESGRTKVGVIATIVESATALIGIAYAAPYIAKLISAYPFLALLGAIGGTTIIRRSLPMRNKDSAQRSIMFITGAVLFLSSVALMLIGFLHMPYSYPTKLAIVFGSVLILAIIMIKAVEKIASSIIRSEKESLEKLEERVKGLEMDKARGLWTFRQDLELGALKEDMPSPMLYILAEVVFIVSVIAVIIGVIAAIASGAEQAALPLVTQVAGTTPEKLSFFAQHLGLIALAVIGFCAVAAYFAWRKFFPISWNVWRLGRKNSEKAEDALTDIAKTGKSREVISALKKALGKTASGYRKHEVIAALLEQFRANAAEHKTAEADVVQVGTGAKAPAVVSPDAAKDEGDTFSAGPSEPNERAIYMLLAFITVTLIVADNRHRIPAPVLEYGFWVSAAVFLVFTIMAILQPSPATYVGRLLDSKNDKKRAEARRIIIEKGRKAIPCLINTLKIREEGKRGLKRINDIVTLLEVLGRIGSADAAEDIVHLFLGYDDKSYDAGYRVREAAKTALLRILEIDKECRDEVSNLLISALQRRDDVACNAAQILGEAKVRSARIGLINAFRYHPEKFRGAPSLRADYIMALCRIESGWTDTHPIDKRLSGEDSAHNDVMEILTKEIGMNDQIVSGAVAEGLGMINDPRSAGLLIALLRTTEDESVRKVAIESFKKVCPETDEEKITALLKIADQGKPDNKIEALRELMWFYPSDPRTMRALIMALNSNNTIEVNRVAARLLLGMRDSRGALIFENTAFGNYLKAAASEEGPLLALGVERIHWGIAVEICQVLERPDAGVGVIMCKSGTPDNPSRVYASFSEDVYNKWLSDVEADIRKALGEAASDMTPDKVHYIVCSKVPFAFEGLGFIISELARKCLGDSSGKLPTREEIVAMRHDIVEKCKLTPQETAILDLAIFGLGQGVGEDARPKEATAAPTDAEKAKALLELIETNINNRRAKFVEDANKELYEGLHLKTTMATAEMIHRVRIIRDEKLNKSGTQVLADAIASSVIVHARKLMREGQEGRKLYFGLGTDWIPGYKPGSDQHSAINPIISDIKRCVYDKLREAGVNAEFYCTNDSALGAEILMQMTHDAADMSDLTNVVIIASKESVVSRDRFGMLIRDDGKGAFVAGIDPAEILKANESKAMGQVLDIDIMELMALALELAQGKEPPQIPLIVENSYDKGRRTIILLPRAAAVDLQREVEINKGRRKALEAA